ncbi:hypothetical protein FKP32DRAFT_1678117 [Trametes sanguinea]|nr:hypothetical protein FKP32DRAFT_1678117 [Trametes sanguinea]
MSHPVSPPATQDLHEDTDTPPTPPLAPFTGNALVGGVPELRLWLTDDEHFTAISDKRALFFRLRATITRERRVFLRRLKVRGDGYSWLTMLVKSMLRIDSAHRRDLRRSLLSTASKARARDILDTLRHKLNSVAEQIIWGQHTLAKAEQSFGQVRLHLETDQSALLEAELDSFSQRLTICMTAEQFVCMRFLDLEPLYEILMLPSEEFSRMTKLLPRYSSASDIRQRLFPDVEQLRDTVESCDKLENVFGWHFSDLQAQWHLNSAHTWRTQQVDFCQTLVADLQDEAILQAEALEAIQAEVDRAKHNSVELQVSGQTVTASELIDSLSAHDGLVQELDSILHEQDGLKVDLRQMAQRVLNLALAFPQA